MIQFDGEKREGTPRTGAVIAVVEGLSTELANYEITHGEVLSAFAVLMDRGIKAVLRHHPTPTGRAQLRMAIAALLLDLDEPTLPA